MIIQEELFSKNKFRGCDAIFISELWKNLLSLTCFLNSRGFFRINSLTATSVMSTELNALTVFKHKSKHILKRSIYMRMDIIVQKDDH